jgi:hypothetical protein
MSYALYTFTYPIKLLHLPSVFLIQFFVIAGAGRLARHPIWLVPLCILMSLLSYFLNPGLLFHLWMSSAATSRFAFLSSEVFLRPIVEGVVAGICLIWTRRREQIEYAADLGGFRPYLALALCIAITAALAPIALQVILPVCTGGCQGVAMAFALAIGPLFSLLPLKAFVAGASAIVLIHMLPSRKLALAYAALLAPFLCDIWSFKLLGAAGTPVAGDTTAYYLSLSFVGGYAIFAVVLWLTRKRHSLVGGIDADVRRLPN